MEMHGSAGSGMETALSGSPASPGRLFSHLEYHPLRMVCSIIYFFNPSQYSIQRTYNNSSCDSVKRGMQPNLRSQAHLPIQNADVVVVTTAVSHGLHVRAIFRRPSTAPSSCRCRAQGHGGHGLCKASALALVEQDCCWGPLGPSLARVPPLLEIQSFALKAMCCF